MSTLRSPRQPDIFTHAERKPSRLVVLDKKSRIGCLLLLPTLTLVFLTAGLSTFFLLWLTVIKRVGGQDRDEVIARSGAFIVDEGTSTNDDGTKTARLLGLTISTVTTQLAEITSPFLCGLAAYCVAGLWLNEQDSPRQDGTNLPTPLQYGLLIRLSSQTGLISIYSGLRYLLKDRPVAPTFVMMSFTFAIVIYGLTQMIKGADLWLHLAAAATVLNTTTPILSPSRNFDYGVSFNESLCGSQIERGCLVQDLGWAGNTPSVQQAGWLISGNASSGVVVIPGQSALSIVSLHDEADLAVIVPVNVNSSSIWSAPSFGIHAQCTNITPDCLMSNDLPRTYNCSSAGYSYLPFNDSAVNTQQDHFIPGHVMATLDGDQIIGKNWGAWDAKPGSFPSNPQRVGVQFRWFIPGEDTSGVFIPNKFVDVNSMGTASAFASCEMSFYNLTIRHDSGKYTLVGVPERTVGSFTATMWGPLVSQMINIQLHANLQGRVLADSSEDNIMAALNQEISRLSLGLFAGSVINAPVHDLSISHFALVGRYPLAPVVTYTGLLYLYSLVAIGVFIWASTMQTKVVQAADGTKATSMELTQLQLTDPMMIIAVTLPKDDQCNTIHTDPLNTAAEDHQDVSRLVVNTEEGPGSDFQFKVRRRGKITAVSNETYSDSW